MRAIKLISVVIMIACSVTSCHAKGEKKVTDKEFQTFLDKFRTFDMPINYKKMSGGNKMTKEEAIRFLHKTEADLVTIIKEVGENDVVDSYIEEHTAGCSFKYLLNDSIYILCTREWNQENVGSWTIDVTKVYLNVFTMSGDRINKCLVGEQFTREEDWVSFVLLDKTHIRVFYYADNDTREKEGFLSTVHYVNYEITGDGKFVEKDKSDITWLKNWANKYSTYKPKSDDPMNAY